MTFKIFIDFFTVGLMCFGGGYSILPFLQSLFIKKGLISQAEFVDMIAISQITPGPIGANLATFTGYRLGGVLSAFVATFALVIPGIFLSLILMHFYNRSSGIFLEKIFYGLRAVATGLIIAAAFNIFLITVFRTTNVYRLPEKIMNIDIKSILILAVCLLLFRKKINYIYVILLSGIAGYIMY